MDATEFAAKMKKALLEANAGVKAVQPINPQLVAGRIPSMPKVALQVELEPHQTFIVWVF